MMQESTFSELYQRPEEIRYWFSTLAGKAFLRCLRVLRDDCYIQLKGLNEPRDIYRVQGKIEILDRILKLKEEMEEVQNALGPQRPGKASA